MVNLRGALTDIVLPRMFTAIQTFGDLLNWHCHIHSIVTEGAYTEEDTFHETHDDILPTKGMILDQGSTPVDI
ncbi:MAG: transposase [Fibrobacteres bacterium]|nr:transposase [Fibrobacterota bacterium]